MENSENEKERGDEGYLRLTTRRRLFREIDPVIAKLSGTRGMVSPSFGVINTKSVFNHVVS